jgi:hypothetical protein
MDASDSLTQVWPGIKICCKFKGMSSFGSHKASFVEISCLNYFKPQASRDYVEAKQVGLFYFCPSKFRSAPSGTSGGALAANSSLRSIEESFFSVS